MKISCNRQKSYANNHHGALKFEIRDKVSLKLSHWKGVIKFGRKKKLSPRYIGPYKILARVGLASYKLRLLAKLSKIHMSFTPPC